KAVEWASAPDAPFATNAEAAGIVALAGHVTGTGDQVALDPAQNYAFRFINRALAEGATVRFEPGEKGKSGQYLVSGIASAKVDAWVDQLSLRAQRVSTSQGSGRAASGRATSPAGASGTARRIALF